MKTKRNLATAFGKKVHLNNPSKKQELNVSSSSNNMGVATVPAAFSGNRGFVTSNELLRTEASERKRNLENAFDMEMQYGNVLEKQRCGQVVRNYQPFQFDDKKIPKSHEQNATDQPILAAPVLDTSISTNINGQQKKVQNKSHQLMYTNSCPKKISITSAMNIGNNELRQNQQDNNNIRCQKSNEPPLGYMYMGQCNQICQHCGALFWPEEKLAAHGIKYHKCCQGGRVVLRPDPEYPPFIKELFKDHHFMENIRAYNQMFSMTSLGAKLDNSINKGKGPYVFKISGQIYHWIGSLCPANLEPPRFLQLYIYDTDNEIANRMSHFTGDEGTCLKQQIVEDLIEFLDKHNALVQLFRTARDKLTEADVPEFKVKLYSVVRNKQYELPTAESIGAIVFEDGPDSNTDFDIIIQEHTGSPKRINKLHPCYMSLQFPLLFVYGEEGYSREMELYDVNKGFSAKKKRLTMNMYYAYQLHERVNQYRLLPKGGRLFQQYVVTAYCAIEQSRLDYIRENQQDIRNDYLSGLYDAITRGDQDGSDVGTRTILPSSFTGGPRYMYSHYLDALAICRVHGNPSFFITFTCNVKWPEIKTHMEAFPELTVADRADVVDRVFEKKVQNFIKFLRNQKPFGEVTAVLYTIEFQKRGLPHCHILLWLSEATRIRRDEEIDKFVSAELPAETDDEDGNRLVSELMIHGPCGLVNKNAACMQNGENCSKNFPKPYCANTYIDNKGYVHYRRRDTNISTIKQNIKLDNAYVVPYNRILLEKFYAHINVEYCGWSMLIKYLFKYISKGTDRVVAHVSRSSTESSSSNKCSRIQVDEIKNYIDARYIGPHEACWRILNFDIHSRDPAVQILAVHLEDMQRVTFRNKDSLESVVSNPMKKKTTLTEWLNFNAHSTIGRHLTYLNFPSEFVWYLNNKSWQRRRNLNKPSIGRLTYVHPSAGDLFYERMLLCHQKGCTSFRDIRTVNKKVYPTYRAACKTLGLLDDDQEWSIALQEAAVFATAAQLRSLFVQILMFCEVSDPMSLWKNYWRDMSDDVPRIISGDLGICDIDIDGDDLEGCVLYEIEGLLNSWSKSVTDFALPTLSQQLRNALNNKALMEEKNYNRQLLRKEKELLIPSLNTDQKQIFDLIVDASEKNRQELVFVYGHGGTGKTFLWNTIICTLRSEGKIVLAVASSGIASLLLPSGRTAHSRFKLPLDLTDESMCKINKNTQIADLLKETDLIIWDEAPMNDRRCFETLDRTLRDILNSPNTLFGGKTIMLGGDFRQTLPVKKKASKKQIINSSIAKSYIWPSFKVYFLHQNMRLLQHELQQHEKENIEQFSQWLIDIGDGNIGSPDESDPDNSSWVSIPNDFCIPYSETAISELISFIYDKETLQRPTAKGLQRKAIVCPRNETADVINNKVLSLLKGPMKVYTSLDEATPHNNDGGETELLYPSEYLNSLDFPGYPPHKLELKKGTPIILLRNLNLVGGLCNGTRMIVTQMLTNLLEVQIITGTRVSEKVFLPRIPLVNKDPQMPFIFKRKQFPVKVCYAMTINKSQGQSLNRIGIFLPDPVFGHGQLYVALSRATSPKGIKIVIKPQDDEHENTTKNIVYKDFLANIKTRQVFFIPYTIATK